MKTLTVLLLGLAQAMAFAAPSWQEDAALRDSLSVKGPLLGHRWLEKNGLEDYLLRQSWKPTQDSGLHCVGRWSFGPSLKVSLQVTPTDTVICLTRGSGASLIRFRSRDSVTLDLLGDVNFAGIPRRAVIADTLVIAGIHSGGTGLEVHGVTNPEQSNLLSRVDLPVVNDIAVKDSLVYVACEDDTLRVYSIADPRHPRPVGSCRDSCDLFMTQAGDYCYLVHVSGVNIVDVSDPANPHRARHIGGGEPLAVYVRDTLCYVTVYQYGLRVWDISDIGAPQQVGSLPGPDALDIGMAVTCDTVVYTPTFDVISVAQPANPRLLGHISGPGGYGVGAVPALDYCLVAAYAKGLVAVDIRNPATPTIDTSAFGAGSVVDIDVAGDRAYLASDLSGMAVLDVANPTQPSLLGRLALPRTDVSCQSVVADDSFAFLHWYQVPQFRSVDVSDPTRPTLAGGADVTNPPEDMVLRDSFVYVAEQSFFEVVNVARPREPVLVGSCVLSGDVWDLDVEDTMAYVTSNVLTMVNIARPDSPRVVATWNTMVAVDVEDTIAYTIGSGAVWSVSVARPTQPYVLDTVGIPDWKSDVVVGESLLFAGGQTLYVIDKRDPRNLRVVGQWTPPHEFRRLLWTPAYLYAACYEAGVCILETVPVGLEEPREKGGTQESIRLSPSVTTGPVTITAGRGNGRLFVRLYDGAGASVGESAIQAKLGATTVQLDLSGYPDGVYFVNAQRQGINFTMKVVKANRR